MVALFPCHHGNIYFEALRILEVMRSRKYNACDEVKGSLLLAFPLPQTIAVIPQQKAESDFEYPRHFRQQGSQPGHPDL